jgi:hypothetical protein
MEVFGQHNALAALQIKKSHYPHDKMLRGPQSQSGCGAQEKKFLSVSENKPQLSSP